MATNDGFVPYALGMTALEAKTALERAASLDAATIKTDYESNADTNAFTDAEKTKLGTSGKVKTTIITASDVAWSFSAGVQSAVITAIGGGGGAAGVPSGTAIYTIGFAGNGGGYCIKTLENPAGTLSITIGAGGAGGAPGPNGGFGGGNTIVSGFGISLIATGGNSTKSNGIRLDSAHASYPNNEPIPTGGDINCPGIPGSPNGMAADGSITMYPMSGYCPIIGGMLSPANGTATDATVPGGGGSAVVTLNTSAFAGGNGFRGEVRIVEYF